MGSDGRPQDASDPRDPARDKELDTEAELFERLSLDLVLGESRTLPEVRAIVLSFGEALRQHVDRGSVARRPGPSEGGPGSVRSARLDAEHQRFRESLRQLAELLVVVEREDHGGHRQALGQYGRILVESLRAHRAEERGGPRRGVERPGGSLSVASGKAK